VVSLGGVQCDGVRDSPLNQQRYARSNERVGRRMSLSQITRDAAITLHAGPSVCKKRRDKLEPNQQSL